VIEGGGKIKPTKFYNPRPLKGTTVKTTPEKFLDLARDGWRATEDKFGGRPVSGTGFFPEDREEIFRGDERGSVEYIRRKLRRGDPVETPYLDVAEDSAKGHEGRHRSRALYEEGVKDMPVELYPYSRGDPKPTTLPTISEDNLYIDPKSREVGADVLQKFPHLRRKTKIGTPQSARIQMARERLGAVGKVKKIKEPIDTVKGMNLTEFKKRGIKLKKPEELFNTDVTDFTGYHFLSPEGKISRDSGPHQNQLDEYSVEHDGVRSWLKDSGVVRIKADTKHRSWLNVENHTKLTEPQIEQISRFINKHRVEMNGGFAHDNFANDFEGSDEIVKRVGTLAKDYRGSYTFAPKDKKMMVKKRQKTEPKTQRTHTQNIIGEPLTEEQLRESKLRQRIAVIGVDKFDRDERLQEVLDLKKKFPTIDSENKRGMEQDDKEQEYITKGKKVRPKNPTRKEWKRIIQAKQRIAGLGFRERILNWLREQPRFKSFDPDSSFVGTVKYDQDNQSMQITLNGKKYDFCNVEERLFDSFSGAGSKGAFFNREIKSLHNCGAW